MKSSPWQYRLPFSDRELSSARVFNNANANKLDPEDRSFHDWYRFVLSYPPHLVRHYLDQFKLNEDKVLLDPFCGTGTTLVEGQLFGLQTIGLEANPVAHFASCIKTDWSIDPLELVDNAQAIAREVAQILHEQGIDDDKLILGDIDTSNFETLTAERSRLLIKNSISPLPLHKVLLLLKVLNTFKEESWYGHQLLALANSLVYSISNLKFGPEVGVGEIKVDVPVLRLWLWEVQKISNDLEDLKTRHWKQSQVHLSDARDVDQILASATVDAVITSPPYPNEKDYTRTTRLEMVLLGFAQDMNELRELKKNLVRSNTRSVYKGDDDDDWIKNFPEVIDLANRIEARRLALGKTSGFEKQYARVTRLYFGGMARHLANLRYILRPGARLAYVVGDQASYLRVMIRTGQILALIGRELGYEVEQIDLFRTRFATATKEELREEVVVFRWPG